MPQVLEFPKQRSAAVRRRKAKAAPRDPETAGWHPRAAAAFNAGRRSVALGNVELVQDALNRGLLTMADVQTLRGRRSAMPPAYLRELEPEKGVEFFRVECGGYVGQELVREGDSITCEPNAAVHLEVVIGRPARATIAEVKALARGLSKV